MPKVGPYSSPHILKSIDGRTKEGRLLSNVRAQLVAHVGGKPSATQRALIDRAAMLTLHVAQLDARAMDGKVMTEHDSRHYLAWSNSLSRTLRELGLKSVPQAPKTLAAHAAARAAQGRGALV